MKFAIGVDGGGSGCRVAIMDREGSTLGQAVSGPANVATNFETTFSNIMSGIHNAAAAAEIEMGQLSDSAVVLGLAGANVGNHAHALESRLPFTAAKVVSDALISLDGALGGLDGTGAMIGTGSVFASRMGTDFRMLGGWGFQVGDQAGGARMGRSLLQETLLAHDNIRSATALTSAVLARFGGAAQMTEFARSHGPNDYAALAPMVLDAAKARDEVALKIIADACAYIVKAVNAVSFSPSLPVTMIGGLSNSLAHFLPAELASRLIPATGNALDGAKRLALRLIAGRPLFE